MLSTFFSEPIGSHFVNFKRSEENLLKTLITTKKNIQILGPQKTGKLFTIKKVLEEENINYLFFDFLGCLNLADFTVRYAHFLIEEQCLKNNLAVNEKIAKVKKHFPSFKIQIQFNEEEKLECLIDIDTANAENCLNEVLLFTKQIELENNLVIIWKNYSILESELEERVQSFNLFNNNTKISYVLINHQENNNLINFTSVTITHPSVEEWRSYVLKLAEDSQFSFPVKFINIVLEITQGNIELTNNFLKLILIKMHIPSSGTKIVEKEHIEWAFKSLSNIFNSIFLNTWLQLSPNQQKALLLITKTNGENLYSSKNLQDVGLNKSAIERCLTSFSQMNLIIKVNTGFRFENPLFRMWLLDYFKI
jgi:hypothetical protein